MTRFFLLALIIVLIAASWVSSMAADQQKLYVEPMAAGKFQPNWDSLKQYECPQWFRDAKFGIWAHWSPQCEPEDGDWYARNMYIQGSGQYNYHVEHYGHPSEFGYKDICNEFKAENWDPDKLIQLYKRAGAKYFVALANHHDGFDMWDSKYQPWNSVNVGPKKDVIGIWARTARKYGLRFGVTVHAARTWDWFDVSHASDKTGPRAGVPYDGNLTKADGKGKWWDGLDPADLYGPAGAARTPEAREKFVTTWYNRTMDLINKYRPDLLYFDDGPMPHGDWGMKILAHLYNANMKWHKGREEAVQNVKGVPPDIRKAVVWDLERGRTDKAMPDPWQTDTCIGDWHYKRDINYKSSEQVVRMLVDIVSKNGNLLLNIPVKGDGTIDDREVKVIEGLATWMQANSEAIFGTRPWKIVGEGPGLTIAEGGEAGYTSKDIRFTSKGDALYAIAMRWPEDGKMVIKSLAGTAGGDEITDVSLLGYKGKVAWTRDSNGLTITLPATNPSVYTAAVKITGKDIKNLEPVTPPQPDTTITVSGGKAILDPASATCQGSVRAEQKGGRPNLGYWDSADDWVSWKVKFTEAGDYTLTTSCAAEVGPSDISVTLAGQTLTAHVEQTAGWEDFQPLKLGSVRISEPGVYTLSVKPLDKSKWKAINLRAIEIGK